MSHQLKSETAEVPGRSARNHHDVAVLATVGKELGAADGALQAIQPAGGWLEDRLYALRHAGWAYAVFGLTATVVALESVDHRAAPRIAKFVTHKVCLKLIPLLQLALKRQNALLYLHLCRLGVDQLVQEVENELLRRGDVDFRSTKKLLEIFSRLGGANDAGRRCAHIAEER